MHGIHAHIMQFYIWGLSAEFSIFILESISSETEEWL